MAGAEEVPSPFSDVATFNGLSLLREPKLTRKRFQVSPSTALERRQHDGLPAIDADPRAAQRKIAEELRAAKFDELRRLEQILMQAKAQEQEAYHRSQRDKQVCDYHKNTAAKVQKTIQSIQEQLAAEERSVPNRVAEPVRWRSSKKPPAQFGRTMGATVGKTPRSPKSVAKRLSLALPTPIIMLPTTGVSGGTVEVKVPAKMETKRRQLPISPSFSEPVLRATTGGGAARSEGRTVRLLPAITTVEVEVAQEEEPEAEDGVVEAEVEAASPNSQDKEGEEEAEEEEEGFEEYEEEEEDGFGEEEEEEEEDAAPAASEAVAKQEASSTTRLPQIGPSVAEDGPGSSTHGTSTRPLSPSHKGALGSTFSSDPDSSVSPSTHRNALTATSPASLWKAPRMDRSDSRWGSEGLDQAEEQRKAIREELEKAVGSPIKAFRILDLSGSRRISCQEFIDGFARLGVAWRDVTGMKSIREVFRLFDRDRNGVVTYQELFPETVEACARQRISTPDFWDHWCRETDGSETRGPKWLSTTPDEELQTFFEDEATRQRSLDRRRWISATIRRMKTQGRSDARCRECCAHHLPRGSGPTDREHVSTFSEVEVNQCRRDYTDEVSTQVRSLQKELYRMRESRRVLQTSRQKLWSVTHKPGEEMQSFKEEDLQAFKMNFKDKMKLPLGPPEAVGFFRC